jgi:hypothetical protein
MLLFNTIFFRKDIYKTTVQLIRGGKMNLFEALGLVREKGTDSRRRKFLGLTADIEHSLNMGPESCRCGMLIDAAVKMRNMLRRGEVDLTNTEKQRVLQTLKEAKVMTFMSGTRRSFNTFQTLDTIGDDLTKML